MVNALFYVRSKVLRWDSSLFQVIAEVVEASIDDYKEGVQGCFEASKIWMKVGLILISYFSFCDLELER